MLCRLLLLIFSLVVATSAGFSQQLVVKDVKTGRTKKIGIGKVLAVFTAADTLANPFHAYADSTRTQRIFCPDGCYRLVAVDAEKNSFTIAHGNTEKITYDLDEVK